MASSSKQPDVGVGVFVLNSSNEFLIGQRKGCVGSGSYALPGGHLEVGESFEDCAAREALEEAGINIVNPKFLVATTGVYHDQGRLIHYVAIFMVATLRKEDETKGLNEDGLQRWTLGGLWVDSGSGPALLAYPRSQENTGV
ncbi:hypothetical protein DV738_g2005, partial [Chaetothyriales sp. CBS 135597]